MAKSKVLDLTIGDCGDMLTVALEAIQESGLQVGLSPSPATDGKPAGLAFFVQGLTVEDGTIVPIESES